MIFNITYYSFAYLVRHDLKGCFITAVAVGLIAFLIITLRNVIKKYREEINRLQNENMHLRKSFKDEYQRIHSVKRKYELILKSNNLNIDAEETIISCVDDPSLDFQNNIDSNEHNVHFNYLNRFGTNEQPQTKKGSNPTG